MAQFLLKLVETETSCCAPRFPLILTAKFHSLYVKESKSEILERSEYGSRKFWEVGVGNFGKVGVGVGVGYCTSDSATLVRTIRIIRALPLRRNYRISTRRRRPVCKPWDCLLLTTQ